jgi:hypothetical protein
MSAEESQGEEQEERDTSQQRHVQARRYGGKTTPMSQYRGMNSKEK